MIREPLVDGRREAGALAGRRVSWTIVASRFEGEPAKELALVGDGGVATDAVDDEESDMAGLLRR